MHTGYRVVIAGACALGLVACGDDESAETDGTTSETGDPTTVSDGTGDESTTSATDGTSGQTTTTGASSSDCPAEIFIGEISRQADGDQVEAALKGDDIVDGIAYGYAPDNFTVYIADHEIDRAVFAEYDEGHFSTDNAVKAEPGGVLVTMFAMGDPLGPGTTAEFGAGTPSPIVDSGGGPGATTVGAAGELTVVGIDDERLCFEIDYHDDFQTVAGTVSTEIHQRD